MMNKRTAWLLFISFAAIFIIAGCGAPDDTPTDSSVPETGAGNDTESNANEESTEGEVVQLHIEAFNFAFDQEEYRVPLGATVEITYENVEGYHEAIVEGYDVEITEDETVTFVADQAGEFEIFCSVVCGPADDHDNMRSKLVVE